MAAQMQTCEFQAHNSPWTEAYDMYCQREEKAGSNQPAMDAEQQPTHDALADVYIREDSGTSYKRV